MNPTLKNILAVITGIIVGAIVNMGILWLLADLIPPPEGVNINDLESLKENMSRFEPKHYLSPFLAHALGTLVGAFTCARIAAKHKARMTYIVGAFFLLGGLSNIIMLPSPTWFIVLDLVLAYIPMAWLGARLAQANG